MELSSLFSSLSFAFLLVCAGGLLGGCSDHGSFEGEPDELGSVSLRLFADGVSLTSVEYAISGPNAFSKAGASNVAASPILSSIIGGLPAGTGFTITLTATATDGTTTCAGTGNFDVVAGVVGTVSVTLDCHLAPNTGSV